MLKPKQGVSTMYEKAERVLDVEVDRSGQYTYILFHLQMPDDFQLLGADHKHVVVATLLTDCEEA